MLRYQSLNELIYQEIKQRIISDIYPPDSRLDIEQIAKELGVSRTPIINALKSLEKDGYVVIAPRSGSFVKKYSQYEIEALFDFREALEGVVVKKAILLAEKEQLIGYKQNFLTFLSELHEGNTLQNAILFFDEQTKFHAYLWSLCPSIINNELQNIVDLTKRICKRHLIYESLQDNFITFFENEISTHINIAEAIIERDVENSVNWMHRDINQTKDSILLHYEEIEAIDFPNLIETKYSIK